MKVTAFEAWPGHFSIAADDGEVTLEVGYSGRLEVSVQYTDYPPYGPGRDEMTTREVDPAMLAEALRRLGWTVTPPSPSAAQPSASRDAPKEPDAE